MSDDSKELIHYRVRVLQSLRIRDFLSEYRVRSPGIARKVDAGSSPLNAIAMKCRECIGDSHPRECTGYSCPLFPYRPGADSPNATQRREGDVPSQEQYVELLRLQDPDGAKAQAARERFGHVAQSATPATYDEDDL